MKNKNLLLIFLFASAYIFGGLVILTDSAQSQSNINSEWVVTSAARSQGNAQELSVEEKSIVAKNLLSIPLLFEKNASPTSVWREGQVDDSVKYLARSDGRVTYFFTQEDVTMLLTKKETEKETKSDVRMTLFGIDNEKQ